MIELGSNGVEIRGPWLSREMGIHSQHGAQKMHALLEQQR
jgi:hypothetical protein